MGINVLPYLKMYWGSNIDSNFCIKNDFVSRTVSYNRFVFIRAHFRITRFLNNDSNNFNTVFAKTSFIIKCINKIFKYVYIPDEKFALMR